MNDRGIVHATMRRGFRAYFAACLPRVQRSQTIGLPVSPIARPSPAEPEAGPEAEPEAEPVPRLPWGYVRNLRRVRRALPGPPPPSRGFYAGVCDGELEKCTICFDTIKLGERILSLNCTDASAHTFHEACIAPWLEDNDSCPVCRSKVI